jgi:hypothetical protein
MGFQKGKPKTGGRLPGQPNKVSLEIKAHARAVIEDPDYQEKLKARLLKGSSPQLEVLLHYYAYGRPRQEIDLTGGGKVTVVICRPTRPVLDGQPAITDHSTSEAETGEAL